MRVRRRLTAGIVVVLLAAAGCGGGGDTATDAGDSTSKTDSKDKPAEKKDPGKDESKGTEGSGGKSGSEGKDTEAGKPAVPKTLKFTSTTLDGKKFDGATLAGKPVALWFWAPWCPDCRGEAPNAKKLQAKYGDKVHFIGVAGKSQSDGDLKKFVAQYDVGGFPQLAEGGDKLWQRFSVPVQSTWVLLDKKGTQVHSGALPGGELDKKIEMLAG